MKQFTSTETALPTANSDRKGKSNTQEMLVMDPCQSNGFAVVEWVEERDEQVMSKPLGVGNVN